MVNLNEQDIALMGETLKNYDKAVKDASAAVAACVGPFKDDDNQVHDELMSGLKNYQTNYNEQIVGISNEVFKSLETYDELIAFIKKLNINYVKKEAAQVKISKGIENTRVL